MFRKLVGVASLSLGLALGSSFAGLVALGGIALTATSAWAKHDGGGKEGGKGGGGGGGHAAHAAHIGRGGGGGGHAAHAAHIGHGGGHAGHFARVARGGGHVGHIGRIGHRARVGHHAQARLAHWGRGSRIARIGRAGQAARLGRAPFADAGRRVGGRPLFAGAALSPLVVGAIGGPARTLAWPAPDLLLYPALVWTPIYSSILWPSDSYVEYWPIGYETIFESAFVVDGPRPLGPSRRGRVIERPGPSVQVCQSEALSASDAAFAPIEQALAPNEAQQAALQEFRQAATRAAEQLRASCPSDLPSSPLARLDIMERQLNGTVEALRTVRPALEKFEQALSDEQRARFALLTSPGEPAARSRRRIDPAAACEKQATSLADWPIERISQIVQPTEAQRDALIDLWAEATKAGDKLKSECPRQIPVTPLARLELMERQLDTARQAVKSVRNALADFYDKLSPEQKARFDAMAEPRTRG